MDDDELTPDEAAWLNSRLRQLRDRDSWLMGTYAEHVVANALPGAEPSASSFAAWDLDWDGISIEVKCSTERQAGVTESHKLSPPKWSVPPHYAWDHEAEDWHPGDRKRWARSTCSLAMKASTTDSVGRSLWFPAGGWIRVRRSR
jgi:hypothetical protein